MGVSVLSRVLFLTSAVCAFASACWTIYSTSLITLTPSNASLLIEANTSVSLQCELTNWSLRPHNIATFISSCDCVKCDSVPSRLGAFDNQSVDISVGPLPSGSHDFTANFENDQHLSLPVTLRLHVIAH